MTDIHAGFWFFVAVTVVDLAGVIVIAAGLMRDEWRTYPSWHKVGLIIAALGLFFQAGRNLEFLLTGVSPSDADLPLWALKDLGISTVAVGYALIGIVAWRQRKAEEKAINQKPVRQQKGKASCSPRSKTALKKPPTTSVTRRRN